MVNRTDKGRFAPGWSGNPTGRPKLPAEMKEMFQAKAPEAFEVLCKHLHATDPRGFSFCGNADPRSSIWTASAINRCQYQ